MLEGATASFSGRKLLEFSSNLFFDQVYFLEFFQLLET